MLTPTQVQTASVLLDRRSRLVSAVAGLVGGPTAVVELTLWEDELVVTRPELIAFLQDQVETIDKSLAVLGVAIEDPL